MTLRSVSISSFALALACGRQGPELSQPIGETHSATLPATPVEEVDEEQRSIGIVVAEDVRRACDLPDEPLEAPRFDFDEATLRPRGEDILSRVASCVIANRLGDASLDVVGYTDPRGPASYNMQLGLYRAEAARLYLIERGVPGERIDVGSRGELDARGTDEDGYFLDRRVEIKLHSHDDD